MKDGRVEKLVFKNDGSRAQLWNQFDQQLRSPVKPASQAPATQPATPEQSPQMQSIPQARVIYQQPTPVRYTPAPPPNPWVGTFSVLGGLAFVLAIVAVIMVTVTRNEQNWSQFQRGLLRKAGKPASAAEPPVMARPAASKDGLPKRKPDPLRDGWSLALLQEIEWHRFENVAVAYEKALGRDARLTDFGADGGIDIKVFEAGTAQLTRIGQCKAYASKDWVGVNLIREFFGVMAHLNVSQGVFYTTSSFTSDAVAFAQGKPLELVDGATLVGRIKQLELAAQIRLFEVAVEGDYTTPTCASCGIKMVFRQPKFGTDFWGCRNYPRCKSKIRVARAKSGGRGA